MTLSTNENRVSASHPLFFKLREIIEAKQSNLCLSADVTTVKQLLTLAETLGEHICVLKTHVDILEDFTFKAVEQLRQIADNKNFLIFEDRKFADIGNTNLLQYTKGIYRICDWADIINAHILPGEESIIALKEAALPKNRALLLIAEMSSKGHFFDANYQENVYNIALRHDDFVIGFITQHGFTKTGNFFSFTPGVKLTPGEDQRGQQYRTPFAALVEDECDIIIVGRDIIQASTPLSIAKAYHAAGWEAYLKKKW